MENYSSESGKPFGVTGYEIGEDYIRVQFRKGKIYKYSHRSCGADHVNNMVLLAVNQQGLSTYISQQHPPHED